MLIMYQDAISYLNCGYFYFLFLRNFEIFHNLGQCVSASLFQPQFVVAGIVLQVCSAIVAVLYYRYAELFELIFLSDIT